MREDGCNPYRLLQLLDNPISRVEGSEQPKQKKSDTNSRTLEKWGDDASDPNISLVNRN